MVAVAGSATLLVFPVAAWACDTGYREDGGFVTWCFDRSLDDHPKSRGQAQWALDNLEASTDRVPAQQTCGRGTDLILIDDDSLPNGSYGYAAPRQCNSQNVCSEWVVAQSIASQRNTNNGTFTGDPFSNGSASPGELKINLKKTWCHEIGHTMGLAHHPGSTTFQARADYYNESTPDRVNDCMVRGHVENAGDWLRYNFHHRSQDIGSFY